jgi:hypothetical protein
MTTATSLTRRVDELLEYARRKVKRRGRCCKGLDFFEILGQFCPLVAPEDKALFLEVVDFMDQPVEDWRRCFGVERDRFIAANGHPPWKQHGLGELITHLQEGNGLMPTKGPLPREYWLSFNSLNPHVCLRCQCCYAIYGTHDYVILPGEDCMVCKVGIVWERCPETKGRWKPMVQPIKGKKK